MTGNLQDLIHIVLLDTSLNIFHGTSTQFQNQVCARDAHFLLTMKFKEDFSIVPQYLSPIIEILGYNRNMRESIDENLDKDVTFKSIGTMWDDQLLLTQGTFGILSSFKDHKITDDFMKTVRKEIGMAQDDREDSKMESESEGSSDKSNEDDDDDDDDEDDDGDEDEKSEVVFNDSDTVQA